MPSRFRLIKAEIMAEMWLKLQCFYDKNYGQTTFGAVEPTKARESLQNKNPPV